MTALQSVQEPRRIKRNSCAGAKRRPGDDTWGSSETQKPPVGQISKFMSSPGSKKYSAFPVRANHLCKLAPSRPQMGGSRSSRTRGGKRWTRQRRHAQWSQGGPFRAREQRRDDCLSFKGPSQPGNRRRNDLTRIAAEAQHQRRLRRCLNIQAAHCTNDDAVFSPCLFDRDV